MQAGELRACEYELEGGETEPDALAVVGRGGMCVEDGEAGDFGDVGVGPGGDEEAGDDVEDPEGLDEGLFDGGGCSGGAGPR